DRHLALNSEMATSCMAKILVVKKVYHSLNSWSTKASAQQELFQDSQEVAFTIPVRRKLRIVQFRYCGSLLILVLASKEPVHRLAKLATDGRQGLQSCRE